MPYIRQELRRNALSCPITAGELNFSFTHIAINYVNAKGLNYQTLNDIIGAFECCKAEFIRRIVNKYEDSKIAENGDVYPAAPTE